MTVYTKYCQSCGNQFSSQLSYRTKCSDCSRNSQSLTLQRDVRREAYIVRDTASSRAVMPRNGAALAAGFLRQPRSSDVTAREVTYNNGEWKFREEYRRN